MQSLPEMVEKCWVVGCKVGEKKASVKAVTDLLKQVSALIVTDTE